MTEIWRITMSDGSIDYVESDGEPDESSIESGIDADSPQWGCSIVEMERAE